MALSVARDLKILFLGDLGALHCKTWRIRKSSDELFGNQQLIPGARVFFNSESSDKTSRENI